MNAFEPKQFGKYHLLDKIAVGGMAELFRAKLTGAQGFEKLIAIKKILPHLCGQENLVKAFIDEAKLAALLHHENIVQIYDFGSMDGEYFIAMEYLFGKDLRTITESARKRNLPLGLNNILYIACQVCAGLDYSHNLKDLQGKPLNIIHRDINPQNIFITYEGQVRIIDFGIAKAANHNAATKENLIKGKLAYMSPEQANGRSIDHRSDIFSTGIILYELLADRRMFEGDTLHVLSLVQEAKYLPPEEAIADLPPKLDAILHRALAREPEDRYQSCSEMLADLEDYAYMRSLRPNGRSFARYMKELFAQEYIQEESDLWSMSQNDANGKTDFKKEELKKHTKSADDTILLTKTLLIDNLKKINFKHAAVVLGLILLVVILAGIKKIALSRSQPGDSAHQAQLSSANESIEITKLAAGKAALEAEQYTLAVTLFEEILAAEPSMLDDVVHFYINALQGQASELIETEPMIAQKVLLKVLEIDPVNIRGLSQLGYLYTTQENYVKAIDTYQKVTELDPQLPDAFFNLGYVYAITEDYDQAKTMYRRVVELSPSYEDEALFNLAVIQEKLGEHDQCLKNLEQAVTLNPANESAKSYLYRLKQ